MMPTRPNGDLVLSGQARDLFTSIGRTAVLGTASIEAVVGRDQRLIDVQCEPHCAALRKLRGTAVRRGFRAALDRQFSEIELRDPAVALLYLLADELPVAALLSGYALIYRQPEGSSRGAVGPGGVPAAALPRDVCAGWESGGVMMSTIDATGQIPIPLGPPACNLSSSDDLAWHPMLPLPAGGMRRCRLLDVSWDDPVLVNAMFRDTHMDEDGKESVLHEYSLDMVVGRTDLRIHESRATPRVLPWVECPGAASSAERLIGRKLPEVRRFVRDELHGTTTCTHLNDLLRSVSGVSGMLDTLATHRQAP